MCGPADYVALQTCLIRAAELSAAGLTACTLHGTFKYLNARRKKKKKRVRALPDPAVATRP
jgi:hypothetical protein